MALTDAAIRNAKPREKPYKVADSKGLYLQINPAGSKLWRLKYRINGVERKLALGSYPEISLAEAREARDAARKQVAHSIDPNFAKREARIEATVRARNSFAHVADDLIQKKTREGLAAPTLKKMHWFVKLLGPEFGRRPIADITPHEILHELRKHERRGRLETANLLRSFVSRVFRYAVATARADRDPAQLLIGALTIPKVKHFPAITDPVAFGGLLRAIDDYQGDPAVMAALKLTPHLFQRPGEMRQMEWSEIDFDKAVWTIPEGKMKMRQPHAVPLSRQALAILSDMRILSGSGQFVFPSVRTRSRPISDNTLNASLRRMGYPKDQMTAHGFRTSASSLLNESGYWNPDAIERALAHAVGGTVRRIYNQSAYWAERVEMAQWWSDYLDDLREGGNRCPSPRPQPRPGYGIGRPMHIGVSRGLPLASYTPRTRRSWG
ncbi:integrase arm-type DNA-binding domain-containing protein [Sphingopyxis sp. CCNWLW253]|jgi:integrase|uniref:tyrosine-type recombinase/integrase n=1 Tax=unclassified Sphingopyxis TaxID=2614943 RepID=UPI0006C257BD|nr:integrase arm-type DNA-binding domain-containing protein [Sphingopyxis sp. USTB-05]USI77169.1 tyrosine-type recombinase/integrase [Sphingopyxis sp. USTB-05]GAO80372.1 integrase [Sphingopyxis sp. C-1]